MCVFIGWAVGGCTTINSLEVFHLRLDRWPPFKPCTWAISSVARQHQHILPLHTPLSHSLVVFSICMTSLFDVNGSKLYNNHIAGGIPSLIGSLTNLQELYESYFNSCKTEASSLTSKHSRFAWYHCCWMRSSLNSNPFSGTIPWEIGSLTNLQTLYEWHLTLCCHALLTKRIISNLEADQLSGTIPFVIGWLTNLQYLYEGERDSRILNPNLDFRDDCQNVEL